MQQSQKLLNSRSDITRQITQIWDGAQPTSEPVMTEELMLAQCRKCIDEAATFTRSLVPMETSQCFALFQLIGFACLVHLKDHGKWDEFNFETILLGKHDRYGAGPLREWGELGIMIRIGSKLARLENICKGQAQATADESKNDTIVDIVGYCVLGLALLEERVQ